MLQSLGFKALLSNLLLQLVFVAGPTFAHGVMTSPLALGGHNNPDYTVETQDPHIHEPVDFRKNM